MTLVVLKNVALRVGATVLLDDAQLTLERGERVCLLGRNGAGKSTLLRLLAGEVQADGGEIVRAQGLKLAQLPQDVPRELPGTVFDVVAQGLGELGALIARYHHLLERDPENLAELARVQNAIEAAHGWALDARVAAVVSRLGLPGETRFSDLSGGMKRRALLARALVSEPDLLLLDEPTNHLDIDSIAWLEDFLASWRGTLLFVSHDRAFLRRMATRIVELDRGRLQSWPGSYDDYLRLKAAALESEAVSNALFDKRLAQEEAWIRKGVEARRTLTGEARLVVQEAERSGRLVVDAQHVTLARGGRTLIRDLSTTLLRGDKIGIIGPNGAGKTTLLNLLLGKLAPDSGRLKLGSNLQIAYFDQLRAALDEARAVYENIGEGREYVEVDGTRRHVMSYLADFLFTPDRARSPVKSLSGGERSRLLLARLFARPANLIVLDEPTNDLDVETLDLLEERLIEFSGTVLLVSHDREFLDNVATRCLAFEGDARVGDYVGGYSDWLRQRPGPPPQRPLVALAGAGREAGVSPKPGAPGGEAPPPQPSPASGGGSGSARLTSAEKRELDKLPARIEKLEAERDTLAGTLADGTLYRSDRAQAQATQQRLAQLEDELAAAYARWEALESRKGA